MKGNKLGTRYQNGTVHLNARILTFSHSLESIYNLKE